MKFTTVKVLQRRICSFCSAAEASAAAADAEAWALRELINEFSDYVREKLLAKKQLGLDGWDSLEGWGVASKEELIEFIKIKIERQLQKEGDPIDIAAYAAFWWNLLDDGDERETD